MSELKAKRRDFLKILGASSVAAVAPMAATQVVASENKDERRKARYKETDHVKAFYRTNSY